MVTYFWWLKPPKYGTSAGSEVQCFQQICSQVRPSLTQKPNVRFYQNKMCPQNVNLETRSILNEFLFTSLWPVKTKWLLWINLLPRISTGKSCISFQCFQIRPHGFATKRYLTPPAWIFVDTMRRSCLQACLFESMCRICYDLLPKTHFY